MQIKRVIRVKMVFLHPFYHSGTGHLQETFEVCQRVKTRLFAKLVNQTRCRIDLNPGLEECRYYGNACEPFKVELTMAPASSPSGDNGYQSVGAQVKYVAGG